MKLSEISIKFHYKIESTTLQPYLVINGLHRYEYGDRIVGAYGFDEVKLDDRFWKYLCYMALRRSHGVNDGWVTARELNQLFDKKVSPDAQATRKYFQRRLKLYDEHDVLSSSYLIQYLPEEVNVPPGYRGVSVGPYRLSVGPPHLKMSPMNCWSYILGQERIVSISADIDVEEVVAEINEQFTAANYFHVRLTLIKTLGYLIVQQNEKNLILIADLWKLLAATEMFLGLSQHSIKSSDTAIYFYKKAGRSNYRIAQCMHIKANAQGQLGMYRESIKTLGYGEFILRKRVSSKIDIAKQLSYFIIDTGKDLSHIGNIHSGEKTLAKARHKILMGESEEPVPAIELRLIQHYMRSKNWAKAEKGLANMQISPDTERINEYSLFLRTASEFYLRARQWEEARAWCEKAIEYGIRHEMRNHMRKIDTIIAQLKQLKQWDD